MRFYVGGGVPALPPTVSVIIPTFNRYGMLIDAISSVSHQTFRNFELIVVDDGSDDKTRNLPTVDVEAAYPESGTPAPPHEPPDGGFRYVRIEHTGMPGAVRNAGAKVARGQYIAFLDSDDVWLPEKLSLQIAQMQKGGALSHTRELWLRDGRTISQSSQRHKRRGKLLEDSLKKCVIGPSTVMIDRDFYMQSGGFREDIEIAEDYEFWLRLVPYCTVEYIDTALTVKRAGHGDQLTEKYGHIEIFRIHALKKLVDDMYFVGEDQKTARKELSRKCAIYANGARRRGRLEEARKYEDYAKDYRI